MKIVVIETDHAQISISLSAVFEGHDQHFFTPANMQQEIQDYSAGRFFGQFHTITDVQQAEHEIIRFCNENKVDLLIFSPVFKNYKSVLEIAKQVKCKKIFTTHNLNTWIKPRFWSFNSLKEKFTKRAILKHIDYILVEDFIYSYISNEASHLLKTYRFLYIPSYIFQPDRNRQFNRKDKTFKIVLTGTVDKERRNYAAVLDTIDYFAKTKANITFSFAGQPLGEYGKEVVNRLKKANAIHPGIASYFAPESIATPLMFVEEMETSDLVLATSNLTFKSTGTTEFIGKTKPTGALHDMISFQLPGLLPKHMMVPKQLHGSCFNYANQSELQSILSDLLENKEMLVEWKELAKKNAFHFTANEIRKGLPFFNN